MLKMTGIELELISDIGMYLFFGKGMIGVNCHISKRYNSEVNNRYMQSYDVFK